MGDVNIWHIVIGGLLTVAASVFGARATGRSSVRVAEVSVEEGAYVRAEGIYKGAITRLEKELDDLRKEFRAEREARQGLERELSSERELRRGLEQEVGKLKGRLSSNGIDVSDLPAP